MTRVAPREAGRPAVAGRPGGDALETSLLFDVFALNQAVGRLLADAMREGPLGPSEYAVYSAIFELEAASPTRIAGRLGMRLTTFMDQLRAIEGRGHARRIPDPTDRRSYRVALTDEGRVAHRAANRAYEAAAVAFERRLGAGYDAARAALRALRQAAEQARPPASAVARPADADAARRAPATPPSGGRAG